MSSATSANLDFTAVIDNFKQTYAKDLDDNRPNFTVLQELLPPNSGGIEVGVKINIPACLTHHGGESYGTSGDTSSLGTPVAMQISDAQSDQFEITEIVRMPFGLISKAAQSKAARFADKARLMLLSGQTAAKRAVELSLLHGSNSLGKVLSAATTAGTGPWTRVITFTPGAWSDGIWAAADTLPFDWYSALTSGTKRNTGDTTVSAVDFANKTVTFTAAGAITDLNTIQVSDFVYSRGSYAKMMAGLLNIVGTTSGTLLGISTTYSMWQAKQVTVSGPITFGKLLSGISPAVSSGANGQLTALANPKNFADLQKDLASARRLDGSYKSSTLKNGSQAIEYEYSGGLIKLVVHPFMKDGDVTVFPTDNYFRAGSDPDPVMKIGDVNLQVMSSTANVFEWRFWCAQTLLPNILGTSVNFSGITPNAS